MTESVALLARHAYLGTKNALTRIAEDKKGVTAVEYGVIAALIIVVCIGAIQLVGQDLLATFTDIAARIPAPGGA